MFAKDVTPLLTLYESRIAIIYDYVGRNFENISCPQDICNQSLLV